MAKKIMVDPTKLRQAAAKLDSLGNEYQTLYNQLFDRVKGMNAAWKGKDNQAFTNQIEGFRPDLQTMFTKIQELSKFLTDSAGMYETTQSNVVAGASKLTN